MSAVLIERLRTERPWCYDDNDQQFQYVTPELADMAAHEIERLRAAILEAIVCIRPLVECHHFQAVEAVRILQAVR